MRVLFLALTLCAAVASGLIARLPEEAVWGTLAFAVAVGMVHGALDTRLASAAFGLANRRRLAVFFLAYVALAGAMAAVFVLAPVAALVVFLAYAAVHFGQDWGERLVVAAIPGAAVIALPALRFEGEVAAIFVSMTGAGGWLAHALHLAAPFVLAAALLVMARRRDGAGPHSRSSPTRSWRCRCGRSLPSRRISPCCIRRGTPARCATSSA